MTVRSTPKIDIMVVVVVFLLRDIFEHLSSDINQMHKKATDELYISLKLYQIVYCKLNISPSVFSLYITAK